MEAYFYNLDKRKDSTKQPATGTGTKIDLILKEGADYDYPVFQMHTDVTGYNYLKWNDHYYFITGRRYVYNSFYEISCEIDPLASYRGSIKSSTQYILRTSVETLANYNLIDNSYPTEAEPEYYHEEKTIGMTDAGSYVFVVKSGDGIRYYGIDEAKLNTILSTLMAEKQEDLWGVISDLVGTLGPSVLNVTDYIVGCRWMPFPVPTSGASEEIYLGYWGTGVQGKIYSTQYQFVQASGGYISLAVHPETDSKKAFANCSQYHACKVYVPGCGEIPIDFAKVQGNSVRVYMSCDVSGAVSAIVTNSQGQLLGRTSGTLGADVPISGSSINLGGLMSIGSGIGTVVSALAAAGTGGAVGAAEFAADLGAGAVEIGTGALAAIPDVSTKGGAGSYYILDRNETVGVYEAIYELTSQAPTQNGYPSCKIATLSSNGFYQIKNPQVDFGDDLTIKSMIENYMRVGFYVE